MAEDNRLGCEAKILSAMIRSQEGRMSALREEVRLAKIGAGALRGQLSRRDREIADLQGSIVAKEQQRASILEAIAERPPWVLRPGIVGRFLRRCSRTSFARSVRLIEASDLFDPAWYAAKRGDRLLGLDPAVHYLLIGGFVGLNPSERFDSEAYLDANRDVRDSGVNPLLHYLKWGRHESRRCHAMPGETPQIAPFADRMPFRPIAPPLDRFIELAHGRQASSSRVKVGVDVVVPVYGAFDETLACLESVLSARTDTEFRVLVVDDRSPDSQLSEILRLIAGMGLVELIENPVNLGFVASANLGMTRNPDRDVILLNSDTLVFDHWLDRMLAHARRGERVATVTPFTTNGTICSYPRFCQDDPSEYQIGFREFDRRLAVVNRGKSVEIPTGVGFCMFVARGAIQEVGFLDEAAFGRGYGEENDLCMRATAAGWKHLHALDVFVFHAGESSFGATEQGGKTAGLEVLRRRYPDYEDRIRGHIARDPARTARMSADAVRLRASDTSGSTLCFTHVQGGGIARHLDDLARFSAREGRDLFLLAPERAGTLVGSLRGLSQDEPFPNLAAIDLEGPDEEFLGVLRALGVDRIEVHSTWGWSWRLMEVLPGIIAKAGLPWSVTLHDYVTACPRVNLIDESGVYCGERGIEQCRACLARNPSAAVAVHPDLPVSQSTDVEGWRRSYGRFLASAAEVQAPSRDVTLRIERYFPELSVHVRPHTEDLSHISPAITARCKDGLVRVVTIGAIGPHKGSNVLLACAREARRTRSPLEFVVAGYTDIDGELRQAGIRITGPYQEARIGDVVRSLNADVVFLPSVGPETYCYTLSIAMAAGLPICVFDLGAQSERLAGYPSAARIPLSLHQSPAEINRVILGLAGTNGPAVVPESTAGLSGR